MTILLGPASLLVAVRADLAAALDSSAVEEFSTRLKQCRRRVKTDPLSALGFEVARGSSFARR